MLPLAGPLALLLTTTVTGNDFASSGTTPCRGAICTPIAGPTTSGSDTLPMPATRFIVCTYWPTRIGAPSYEYSAQPATG